MSESSYGYYSEGGSSSESSAKAEKAPPPKQAPPATKNEDYSSDTSYESPKPTITKESSQYSSSASSAKDKNMIKTESKDKKTDTESSDSEYSDSSPKEKKQTEEKAKIENTTIPNMIEALSEDSASSAHSSIEIVKPEELSIEKKNKSDNEEEEEEEIPSAKISARSNASTGSKGNKSSRSKKSNESNHQSDKESSRSTKSTKSKGNISSRSNKSEKPQESEENIEKSLSKHTSAASSTKKAPSVNGDTTNENNEQHKSESSRKNESEENPPIVIRKSVSGHSSARSSQKNVENEQKEEEKSNKSAKESPKPDSTPSTSNKPQLNTDMSIDKDNRERFDNIFKITTPHSSRSLSMAVEDDIEIPNEPPKEIILSSSNNNNKSNKKVEKEPEEEIDDYTRAYRDLINRGTIPPPEYQQDMCMQLRKETLNALVDQDYDLAAKLEDATNLLTSTYVTQCRETEYNSYLTNVNSRISEIQQKINHENNKWNKIFNTFKAEQTKQREQLQQKHKDEMAQFEQNWGNAQYLMPYNKPSPQLLSMRKIQKSLALSKRFNDAKQVKERAEILQQQETEEAQRRAIAAMKNNYIAMMERQQKEMACFEEHEKRTELYLIDERGRTIHPMEMEVRKLEIERDRDKPPNLNPRKDVLKTVRTSRTKPRKSILMPPSPRTTRAIRDFKVYDDPPKLGLTGLNVSKIMNRRSAATSLRVSRKNK